MTVIPCHGLRADVHAVLDDIWLNAVETGGYRGRQLDWLRIHGERARKSARERVYAWLAEQMWLLPADCHVSRFTFDQCMEALCLLHGTTYAEIRAWAQPRKPIRKSRKQREMEMAA